jgi:thiosulfate/3-mercaptopyruvate sulfurtransferase
MNMRTRFILFVLSLAASGFCTFSELPASVFEIRMKNQVSGTSPGILQAGVNKIGVPEPWTAKQLMAPADLAAIINDPNAKKPVILCVGPGALIKGSLDMGPAKEKINLEKLKQQLSKLPRDTNVVIYCGCCPFDHCPNIRPAFNLLNEMKFSNAHLLNLEHNIKTDWVAKGYPQA